MSVRIDGAPSPSRAAHEGRWRAGRRLRAWIGPLLTGRAEGFVDQSSEGFGFCGAVASVLVGCKGQWGRGGWLVGPPDMNQETENEQSNQKVLVKQDALNHDDAPFHDDERRLFYRIHSLSNYPLDRGTAPDRDRKSTRLNSSHLGIS